MAWKITWEGEVYREADLTLGQVERIEQVARTTWRQVHPLFSAQHAIAILGVLVADRTSIKVDEAVEKLRAVRVSDVMDAIDVEDPDDQMDLPATYEEGLPKAEAARSTPTS